MQGECYQACQYDNQAADSRDSKRQYSPPGRDQRQVNTCPHTVLLRILRNARSSSPGKPVVLSPLLTDSVSWP